MVGDSIVCVGELGGRDTRRAIDATGMVAAPGFIDVHTHSDDTVLANPKMESKVRQGITTEVCGNCGDSAAPVQGQAEIGARKRLQHYGVELSWRSLEEWFQRLGEQGVSANVVTLIGHGTLRASVMGHAMRPPTQEEMLAMMSLLAESMEAGAFGLSTGLIYPPSSYAELDELVELSKVAASYGGLYASHLRNEGDRLIEAVAEAVAIGERAGIPVELSHHKAAGKANWGKVQQSLELIEKARYGGLDVSLDQYPYTASSTGLSVVLPDWVHEGGDEAMVERLKEPVLRARIASEVRSVRPGWENPANASGWHNIILATCRSDPGLEGKSISEISQSLGRDPVEAAFDLLIANEGNLAVIIFSMCEDDVQTVMRYPPTMVGSDASAKAPYGPTSQGKPHPRAYGTFPRVLGRYVRELGVLGWEEAVAKMTSKPAAKLGLSKRGVIAEGNHADIVVFDPKTVSDQGTFTEPHRYPVGIAHVVVNGTVTQDDGEHTGALSGRILKRGR